MEDHGSSGPGPRPTLGSRLGEHRRRRFAGRGREVAVWRAALAQERAPFAVLHVWGPGGIGKSTLLDEFTAIAEDAGRRVVRLDGRDVPASADGVEAALRTALGTDDVDDALGALADLPGAVLMIDTYETLAPLDGWLRDRLLPRLPADALVVLAGRERPAAGWRSGAWRDLSRVLPLGPLSEPESRELLRSLGVLGDRQQPVLEFSHGHPLALSLAGDVLGSDAGAWGSDAWGGDARGSGRLDVIRMLVDKFAATAPTPQHRRALEACARASSTTEELLRAVLDPAGTPRAGELFRWLRGLSFVDPGPYGLRPHDLVRDLLEEDLRWRDPAGSDALTRRLARYGLRRVMSSGAAQRERAVFELTFLYRADPWYGAVQDFDVDDAVWQDRVRPGDDVHAVIERAEGGQSAAIAAYWLTRDEAAFRVYRSRDDDQVVAVGAWLLLERPVEKDLAVDPIVAAVWRHVLRAGPPHPTERISVARFWVHPPRYQRPSPVTTLVTVHSTARWISDQVTWSVIVVADPEFWAPYLAQVDHVAVEDQPADVGGRRYGLFVHDWRARPLREWFAVVYERITGGRFDPATDRAPAPRLDDVEFTAAVRDALRDLHRPDRLAVNPLIESPLAPRSGPGSPVDALAAAVREAVDAVRAEPGGDKLHRALDRTYLRPAPSQERAAELLGLPYSTFRRHLTRGVERVTAHLRRREGGAPGGPARR